MLKHLREEGSSGTGMHRMVVSHAVCIAFSLSCHDVPSSDGILIIMLT